LKRKKKKAHEEKNGGTKNTKKKCKRKGLTQKLIIRGPHDKLDKEGGPGRYQRSRSIAMQLANFKHKAKLKGYLGGELESGGEKKKSLKSQKRLEKSP